jgi:hypothetical protein
VVEDEEIMREVRSGGGDKNYLIGRGRMKIWLVISKFCRSLGLMFSLVFFRVVWDDGVFFLLLLVKIDGF